MKIGLVRFLRDFSFYEDVHYRFHAQAWVDYPIYGSPMVYRWIDKAAGKDELMGGMGFIPSPAITPPSNVHMPLTGQVRTTRIGALVGTLPLH